MRHDVEGLSWTASKISKCLILGLSHHVLVLVHDALPAGPGTSGRRSSNSSSCSPRGRGRINSLLSLFAHAGPWEVQPAVPNFSLLTNRRRTGAAAADPRASPRKVLGTTSLGTAASAWRGTRRQPGAAGHTDTRTETDALQGGFAPPRGGSA